MAGSQGLSICCVYSSSRYSNDVMLLVFTLSFYMSHSLLLTLTHIFWLYAWVGEQQASLYILCRWRNWSLSIWSDVENWAIRWFFKLESFNSHLVKQSRAIYLENYFKFSENYKVLMWFLLLPESWTLLWRLFKFYDWAS